MEKKKMLAALAAVMMLTGMASCGRYDDPEFSDTAVIENSDSDPKSTKTQSGEKLDWSATRAASPNNGGNNGGNANNNPNNPNNNQNNNPNNNRNNNPNYNQNNNPNYNGNNNNNNRNNTNYNYNNGGGNYSGNGNMPSGSWNTPNNIINSLFNNSRNNAPNNMPPMNATGMAPTNPTAGNVVTETTPVIPENTESSAPAAVQPEEEDNTIAAEITLGDESTATGDHVTVSGGSVHITAGGNYHITGAVSDGQIYVDTSLEEKVKLILDGVDISCQSGPAILIEEAKRCTIEMTEGSYNRLSDGGGDKINDGVIFSNDTLDIKGVGTLEINSGNAHGIASDDDVIIESGTYIINAVKSGIYAHDDVTIEGGNLNIKGGTNGIKSRGSVNIKSGRTIVSGGLRGEKSAISAKTILNYEGGELYAVGRKITDPTTSTVPYVVVKIPAEMGMAGNEVEFVLNGAVRATVQPDTDFRYLLMLASDMREDMVFNSRINGEEIGDNVLTTGRNAIKVE